ncbi:Response regulator domain protein [Candidatus Bealeia paramacronuclearis]|uniref:Response regulator domain protein n=1 Tax=Candidatus Bealeia paramacronuclearis TaxID=1921001 RepID=A0ABZ2C056_9PROT|nr:Response regulator domain protein [Candidatus Bealeia paramacronuclearis]
MKSILFYVEGYMEEIVLLRFFLKKYSEQVELISFENGMEFLNYLSQNVENLQFEGRQKKYCILLDLNINHMNGFYILNKIKNFQNDVIKEMPVVIYSSSRRPSDRTKSLNEGASLFIEKPFDYDEMEKSMELLYNNYLAP